MAKVRATDLSGKVIVITGANAGIGKETAIRLAEMGATVVMTARSELRGGKALSEVTRRSHSDDVALELLDLANFSSIRSFAERISNTYDRVDVLINNAGGLISQRQSTQDGFEMTFGVNHLGHFLLTSLMQEQITASAPSRIINVASIGHRMALRGMSFSDLSYAHGYQGTSVYAESKLANVLFTMELAGRLEGTGVTANCLHPGPVRTQFGAAEDTSGFERFYMAMARPFLVTARRGSSPSVFLASAPEIETTTGTYWVGGFFPGVHRHRPSRHGRNPEEARRLWDISEDMIASVPAG